MRHKYFTVFTVCIFCTLPALIPVCSGVGPVAGSASQSGNGMVSGLVVYGGGTTAPGSRICLRKNNYDPVACTTQCFSRVAIANDSGRYEFDTVPVDTYTIEVFSSNGLKALRFGIKVPDRQIIELPADTLKYPGVLKVHVPDTLIFPGAYVYVPGTSIKGYVDTVAGDSGYLKIDSVSTGLLPSLCFRFPGSSRVDVDTTDFQVFEHDTTEIDFQSNDTLNIEQ